MCHCAVKFQLCYSFRFTTVQSTVLLIYLSIDLFVISTLAPQLVLEKTRAEVLLQTGFVVGICTQWFLSLGPECYKDCETSSRSSYTREVAGSMEGDAL